MPRADALVEPPSNDGRLRVLAAIELGGNWGHLLRVKPLLETLRGRGHPCALATPEPAAAARMFAGAPVEIFACPSLNRTHPVPAGLHFKHYVQILEHCAFGADGVLDSNLRQWVALTRRVRPDVILAEFSPMALLVAHLCRIPVVQVPTGWEAPPAGEVLPLIPPWQGEDAAPYADQEARLLARLNRQCVAHRVPPFNRVSDLYAIASQMLCTWPETDHFAPRRHARYIGPIFSADRGHDVGWAATPATRTRVFIYLVADWRNDALLEALCRADVDAVAVLPGISADAAQRLRASGVRVFDGAVRIDSAVRHARLVISNGGHGLIGASLGAGVPLLMLPRTAEQAMLVDRLVGFGLAHKFGAPDQFGADLHRALADGNCQAAARAMADRYAGSTVDSALIAVADEVERTATRAAAQI